MADLYRPYGEGLLSEEPTRFEDMYAPAATGLLFAPGAGVADLMGRAPDPSQPGEMLPSFYENITGGNYLDAGLQALGGAGDAVQMMGAAFPPLVAVGAGMKLPRGIRAFHGSPYDFDKFSLDKIGTGEGAQAYGRGLYFAENEGIARNYRDTLSAGAKGRASLEYAGDRIKNLNFETPTEGQETREQILDQIATEMSFFDQKPENVINRKIKMLEADIAKPLSKTGDPETDEINELTRISDLRQLEVYKGLDPEKFKRGKMYEVNIAADPNNMIDYDASISDMPNQVRARLYKNPEIKEFLDKRKEDGVRPEFYTGATFYDEFSDYVGGENVASDILNEAGIPGIKYFSDTSRNTSGGELIDVIKDADGFKAKVAVDNRAGGLGGKGRVVTTSAPYKTEKEARDWAEQATKNQERNFVVFDDSLIEIMRKYGLLAPLVGAGTVAAVSDTGEDRGLLEM